MQWLEVITLSLAFLAVGMLLGYSFGRTAHARAAKADPRMAYTHAELHGFSCGIVAALAVIQSKTDPPSRSPPVSGAGLPVADAGGETG
ncbi:hypothetical protein [Pseudomonas sp.]|uniref:hypothetical protein n=1 Tax=Pseudomonas sp. TaxID=306 RepID=UPI0039825599